NKAAFHAALQTVEGYEWQEFILKSQDYGLPQHRVRLCIVLLRKGQTRCEILFVKSRKARASYLKAWRKVTGNPTLKRVPNYWRLVGSKKVQVCPEVSGSPSKRKLLTVLSEGRNLMKPNVILNTSQSAGRHQLRDDGLVPTLSHTCGGLFAPAFGAALSPAQCLALQGHAGALPLERFSRSEIYSMAGMAMSVPVVGVIMTAV
ncbi:unnamed protein product, partial [Prorocentrum cordatum]